METITLIKHDNWLGLVERKAKAKHIKLPKQSFEFGIEGDWHLIKKTEGDPLLHEKMMLAANKSWHNLIEGGVSIIVKCDEQIKADTKLYADRPEILKKMIDGTKKKTLKDLEDTFNTTKSTMEKDVKALIKSLYKKYDELCKYRAGVFFRGAARIGAVVLSIGGIIKSAGTNGFAWWALAKSCASIGGALKNARRDLGTVQKNISEMSGKLGDRIKKHPKWAKTRELGAIIMPAITGKEFGSTMTKMDSLLKVHKQKRLVLWKTQHNLAVELRKTIDALQKEKIRLPKHSKRFDKMLAKANNAMDRIAKIETQLKEAETFENDARWALGKMRTKCKVKDLQKVARTLMVLAAVGKAIALDLSSDDSTLNGIADMLKDGDEVQKAVEADAAALKAIA